MSYRVRRRTGLWFPDQKPIYPVRILRNHPLANGLQCYFPFNELGKDRARDVCGFTTGTLAGGITWDASGILADGDYERVDIGDAVDVLPNVGTILFEYGKTASPTWYYFFCIGSNYQDLSFLYGTGYLYLYAGGSGSFHEWNTGTGPVDGYSHLLGISWVGGGGDSIMYFDQDFDLKTSWVILPSLTGKECHIGARTDATARYAGGSIKWWGLWDRVLDIEEVREFLPGRRKFDMLEPWWPVRHLEEPIVGDARRGIIMKPLINFPPFRQTEV